MNGRTALVTGAGGFVGQALATGLADRGWDVVGVDRAFDAEVGDARVARIVADLADGVPADVPTADLVVHAAWTTTDPETLGVTAAEYHEANLRPLAATLHFCARVTPTAFVFLSSSGVFAPDDATGGLTDADVPTGSTPYAVAKREGEARVTAAAVPGATAFHIVRLGYLFGPGEVARPSRPGVSLVARWFAAAREGGPLEARSDDPEREWTFTPDLAPALERVVQAPPAGHPIHLGSPHVCRDRALAGLVADLFPGTEVGTVPAVGRVKPPMVPSDVAALRGFAWTDVPMGLRALVAGGAHGPVPAAELTALGVGRETA
jgi:UDP-glucose 4-epimerase